MRFDARDPERSACKASATRQTLSVGASWLGAWLLMLYQNNPSRAAWTRSRREMQFSNRSHRSRIRYWCPTDWYRRIALTDCVYSLVGGPILFYRMCVFHFTVCVLYRGIPVFDVQTSNTYRYFCKALKPLRGRLSLSYRVRVTS